MASLFSDLTGASSLRKAKAVNNNTKAPIAKNTFFILLSLFQIVTAKLRLENSYRYVVMV
jgi:hypothetical protein